MTKHRTSYCVCIVLLLSAEFLSAQAANKGLCLDGFCIGQSINDARFTEVNWVILKDGLGRNNVPELDASRKSLFAVILMRIGKKLAEVLSWHYGLMQYNIITKANVGVLRGYKYECNPSPRGIDGERRFLGAYRSSPSQFLTVVGLRLVGGELRVYRIARQYPFHNQTELISLGRKVHDQYGNDIVFYDGVTSNAYSDVVEQNKEGWFGRSTMFNPRDLADNAAEFVLIDPRTRELLEPSSMPDSGEIKQLANRMPKGCSTSILLQ